MAYENGTVVSGEALLDVFGRMFVINLQHRTDRRAEFSAQLAKIGLGLSNPRINLFAAVRPDEAEPFSGIGVKGCFLSHLGVLRQALEQDLDTVLICEDDLDFAPDLSKRVGGLQLALKDRPWDVIYGFAPAHLMGSTGQATDGFLRVAPQSEIVCAHFIAFRKSAIQRLVPYLEAMLGREPGDPAGGPMHVDGAYNWFRRENPDLQVLAACPDIGLQRSSMSDIAPPQLQDRLSVLRLPMRIVRKWRNSLPG